MCVYYHTDMLIKDTIFIASNPSCFYLLSKHIPPDI